ncbi:hypothetical protein [Engelhardtia mirabilis]|uniref:hypothetical protein n=1 Tax=Engelhardtia mirabilis TaxID=2528011 RepID=UPI003AF3B83D
MWIAALALVVTGFGCLNALLPIDGAARLLWSAALGDAPASGAASLAAATWRTVLCLVAAGAVVGMAEGGSTDARRRWPSLSIVAASLAASAAAALVLERGEVWPPTASVLRSVTAALAAMAAAALSLRWTRTRPALALCSALLLAAALWGWLGFVAAGAPEAQASRGRFLLGGYWAPSVTDTALALLGWAVTCLPGGARRWAPLGMGLVAASVGPLPLVGALALVPGAAAGPLARGLWGGSAALLAATVSALIAPSASVPAGALTLLVGSLYLAGRLVWSRARPGSV